MALTSLQCVCNMYKSTIPTQTSYFKFAILSWSTSAISISQLSTLEEEGRHSFTLLKNLPHQFLYYISLMIIQPPLFTVKHPYTISHTLVRTSTVVTFNAIPNRSNLYREHGLRALQNETILAAWLSIKS